MPVLAFLQCKTQTATLKNLSIKFKTLSPDKQRPRCFLKFLGLDEARHLAPKRRQLMKRLALPLHRNIAVSIGLDDYNTQSKPDPRLARQLR